MTNTAIHIINDPFFVDPTIVARAGKLNPKTFPIGSLVYYLKPVKYVPGEIANRYFISYGIVIEHYTGEIAIQCYEQKDRRRINGIPVKEFCTPSKWTKLPKGWSYDTVLFNYEFDEVPVELKTTRLDDSEGILALIQKGLLVKVSENDHAKFTVEIDSKYGWRIIREYDWNDKYSDIISLPYYEVYQTYEEAQQVLNEMIKKVKENAALSDLEWRIKQIDRNLDLWAKMYSISNDEKQMVRQRLLSLENVEDVVTRIGGGGLQWKYDRNKVWKKIEL